MVRLQAIFEMFKKQTKLMIWQIVKYYSKNKVKMKSVLCEICRPPKQTDSGVI